jgi:ribosomal protein S18 acetylase RimI-like enzyme
MTPDIIILSASDAPQYKAVMLHAYEHAANAFTSTPEERAKEPDAWWVKRIADPDEMTISFGAKQGADLVGTVALEFSAKPKTMHKAHVVGMYVMPAWRGRGLARGLLQAAIDHCVARGGILAMQLEVTEGNEPAAKLYRELGFSQFGLEPMAILTPSGFKSKVHMWLSIAGRPNAV